MTQSKILIETIYNGARADLKRVRSEPAPPRNKSWEYAPWQARQDDAANNIVGLNAIAWLGVDRITDAASMAVSRAYRAGEKAGRWHRVIENGRTVALLLLGVGDD